ncbi:MAG TPA: DUF2271 domain-containing protein [Bacteroidales bacterium]|nr:DUF2271 domain-containing protein [Bacteroidales bacterium]
MRNVLLGITLMVFGFELSSQTSGELTFTVTTSGAGGGYAPNNIVAVWIEDESDNFIRTIYAYNGVYKTHLNIWEASSGFNTTDANTGATYSGHTTRSYVWDGKNSAGILMPDSNYKLRIELTDKNATGNYNSYTFTKGIEDQTINPADQPSFSNITISWIPETSNLSSTKNSESVLVTPNPTSGIINVKGKNIKSVEVINITGQSVLRTKTSTVDISSQPDGLYIIKFSDDNGNYTRKIIKQ